MTDLVPLPVSVAPSLQVLRAHGAHLRGELHLGWPAEIDACTGRWLLDHSVSGSHVEGLSVLPPLIGIVGGASAGKSTVFNNLLGGQVWSRVTAEAHATRGLILAAHEGTRAQVAGACDATGRFADLHLVEAQAGASATGQPDRLTVVWHQVEALRGVWLVDTPDVTSEAARREGDITYGRLPWFDRLVVVVDSERWFDRQSLGVLAETSQRWGQKRYVLFNRTREERLAEADRAALLQQAARLAASGTTVLEFRRGRGLVQFPPGTFDDLSAFLTAPRGERGRVLLGQIGEAARRALNQNEERLARLEQLRESLRSMGEHLTPSPWQCMTALMVEAERSQLDVVSRILGVDGASRWLGDRFRAWRRMVPGASMPNVLSASGAERPDDRAALADALVESVVARACHEVSRVATTSRFWHEIRRWTGIEPAGIKFVFTEALRDRFHARARSLDKAMRSWNQRVESECVGVSPHLRGAAGVGLLGMAIVLIAVPGPLTALTLLSAKAAIGGALSSLATAAGFGAIFGRQIGRLVEVAKERLVGSEEFNGVKAAAAAFRGDLALEVDGVICTALEQAESLTLEPSAPLCRAMEAAYAASEEGR